MKLLSLFDGSGGFPLAASMCGITPVMAAEVEPYPIAVTKSHFPHMKHLGNVQNIHGNEIEPVDIITFGSPCQDLSVAGKRKGLKHAENGDDETTRSGLFMEAVRIIKEMREATNGVYPRYAVWEIVPRSSTGLKTNLRQPNSIGVIDSDYRGEVKAMYESKIEERKVAHSGTVFSAPVYKCVGTATSIKAGDRIAQMILRKKYDADLVEVEELSETERGENGFGSTGK